ncbi:MAG TPA: HDOD domain-containing protein [Spirochaetota bacterium]|nr:HDOD domain-containing protein [Spirochaetota bacterium]
MGNGEEKKYTITPPDFKTAITEGKDFYIQFHLIDMDVEAQIIKIVHRYLEKFDILYIKDTIITVLKELINNSIKANIKRLYFKLKGLDINKTEDYRTGMETFKEDIYQSGDDEIFNKLEESNLVVRISFKNTENHIHINVINNIPILDSEIMKINSRIKKAYKYVDISDAFDDVLDESEGAGLGLIMAMMLFKNSGLPAESFRIYRKGDLTIATVSIPKDMSKGEVKHNITQEILKEIEAIPAFPENIKEIQRHCNNPEATIREIADSISRDPGLTTSILKLANSAGYITIKKVDSIDEAVKIIGIRGINTLLVATGVHKVIDSRYKKFESIWKDSYKRAYYSQRIASQVKKARIGEFAYLAGLLADIGKIVLLSINPEQLKKLKEIAGNKAIEDPTLLEEISLGISHSSLGGMICKKWHFNDSLIQAIEYHNRPHMSPPEVKNLVNTVYLADVFVEIENRKSRFDIVDEDVLEFFDLTDRNVFAELHSSLKETYINQLNLVHGEETAK